MLLEFEVQRSSRRCAATDRPLEPGEECYAALEAHGAEVIRKDYCHQAWNGPPEGTFASWKWRVPAAAAKKIKLAPNDALLDLFDQLTDEPLKQDTRYVLALLLVRRRVFRLETSPLPLNGDAGRAGQETENSNMIVYCPKRDTTYEVAAVMPTNERIDEIQQQLSELLIAGAE